MLSNILRRVSNAVLAVVMLFAVGGPMMPTSTSAAPNESGVYTEDFSTYTAKHYADNAVWDIWSHSLRLARPDGPSQSVPAIARDSNGNTVLVWYDSRNGNTDIYAQKLDVNGNRLWLSDVRVNSDSSTAEQRSPTVAMDGSGNAVIVWDDSRTGNYDIYAQKLDASGIRLWAADVRVNSDSGTADQYAPTVAIDGNSNAVIVWQDNSNNIGNNDSDIYAQKLGISGNKFWALDVRIDSDSGTKEQSSPVVAVDGSGNAVMVWQDYRNGNTDIYAQKLDASGNKLWTLDVRVNSDTGTKSQWYPTVDLDESGKAVIVWQDFRNGNYDIYAQKLDASGNRLWATDVRVNSDIGTVGQYDPAVAMDGNETVVIVWHDSRNGDADIYTQKLNAGGSKLWAVDARVNSYSGTAGQQSPAVVVDGSGTTVIAWHDSRNGYLSGDIYGQRLNASGNRLWTGDVRINSDGGTAMQGYPAVAVDVTGNAVMVWYDNRGGNEDIYVQKVDVNGNRLWTANIRANSDSGTAAQDSPVVAVDWTGAAVVVWHDKRNGHADIYAQKLDANGNRLWATDLRVNSDSGTADQWYPAVAVDDTGNAVIVWEDQRYGLGNSDIRAQKLGTNGNRLWATDVRVNSDSGTDGQYHPQVVVDGTGTTMMVWMDYRNTWGDIYAQKLDASGNRLWTTDVRVNSDSGVAEQSDPAVAADGSGSAVIVWRDERNSTPDIYAQKLDASGNRLWATDVCVNSDSGTAWQWFSAVAVDGSGNAAVVWSDSRNYNTDIYAQKLNTSGNKLWATDVLVNSDIGAAEKRYPAVAADGSGTAVIVWQDERNGNGDIYAQKINSVGGKGWLADLQVVYPDRFYFPTGLAQSRTVDTLVGDIRQATLTTNYQLNGGNVEFALSNNGGTNWLTATLGTATVFTTTGSDLRWRVALTGDPVWRNRSPIVTSLRIEYSTQVPYADDYEADDTCAQAKPIATGGAAQSHTFHQPADADWTWFNVVSGTTYILQTTNVGTQAQTRLEFRPACAVPPTGSSISLGNGVTLNFTANQTGPVYVKVFNQSPAVFGPNTTYQLSARVVQPTALAVIIAGHDNAFSAQANITWAADRAYKLFRRAGLGKANIRFLDPNPNRDVDGNGNATDDIAGLPTIENVRAAIQDWPRERGVALGVPLYIYLVDHGLIDHFKANGDALAQQVTATDLNLWLSNLEATTGTDNLNIIIDACYSGSFIDLTSTGLASISGHNRVVIASTTSAWNAYGPADGQGLYFSNAFFTALENQQSLQASFEAGRQAAVLQEEGQQAWLDDNGDRLYTATDGVLAANRALQRVTLSGQPPRITALTMPSTNGLQAQVVDDSAWVGVTVDIFAPDYMPPPPDGSGTTRIITVPVATLTDPDTDGLFTATYPFTLTGWYRLVAHAEDTEGNLALPVAARVCVNCSAVYLPLVRKSN